MSEVTTEQVAGYADGLFTTPPEMEALTRIVTAFRQHAPAKLMHLKVDLSWATDAASALHDAHDQWRFLLAGRETSQQWETPEDFACNTRHIAPSAMYRAVLISAELDQHVEWLRARAALGFESLDLHNVGRNQEQFIESFGRNVLPALQRINKS